MIDRVTGLQVDGGSVESIALALKGLLSDARFRNTLGSDAYSRAKEHYSWEYVAKLTSKEV